MNFTGVLKLLLIVSIVLQSLTAIASASSENHQIDIQHLQTEHDHKTDVFGLDSHAVGDEHDVKDCHHCGHCSGSHLSWVIINHIHQTAQLFTLHEPSFQFDQTKQFLEAILRPPIA